jgi:hypothetical protein
MTIHLTRSLVPCIPMTHNQVYLHLCHALCTNSWSECFNVIDTKLLFEAFDDKMGLVMDNTTCLITFAVKNIMTWNGVGISRWNYGTQALTFSIWVSLASIVSDQAEHSSPPNASIKDGSSSLTTIACSITSPNHLFSSRFSTTPSGSNEPSSSHMKAPSTPTTLVVLALMCDVATHWHFPQ